MESRPWPDLVELTKLLPVPTNPRVEANLRRALQTINLQIRLFNNAVDQLNQAITAILANAADIGTNAAGIGTNAADIGTNAADIAANAGDIGTIQGDYLTSAFEGSEAIVTLGTIATGTWQGTAVAPAYLGLSFENYSVVEVAGEVGLAGDVEAPGADKVYGTDGDGYREWKEITVAGTISAGTWQGTAIDHERGGLKTDVSAYDGLVKISGGDTSAVGIGIGNGNAVLVSVAGVADDDYAKFTATGVEGRSYAEVKTDLSLDSVENTALSTWAGTTNLITLGTVTTGTWSATVIAKEKLATDIVSLGTVATGVWEATAIDLERGGLGADISGYEGLVEISGGSTSEALIGIADTNVVVVDGAGVADNDYAKFTAAGLEGRSYAEVKTDLSLNSVENTALSTWAGTINITTLGTISTGTWEGTPIDHERGGLETDVSGYAGLVKISGGNTSAVTITAAGEAILDDADAAAQRTTLGIVAGIADTNYVVIDGSPNNNNYLKFTLTGVEGRSYNAVKSDLSLSNVENTALSTWAGTENVTTLGTVAAGTWEATAIDHERGGLETNVSAYNGLVKISGGNTSAVGIGIGYGNAVLVSVVGVLDNDYAKFTATGVEGRSYAEVKTDLGLSTGDTVRFYMVGVGRDAATYRLEVEGDVRITGGIIINV